MKIVEFASAEEQLALWKLVSDNVWGAISQQATAEAEQKALKKAQAKTVPKSKGIGMPPPKFVPPTTKLRSPKPNPQIAKAMPAPKPATSIHAKGGVIAGVQPKAPADRQQPANQRQH